MAHVRLKTRKRIANKAKGVKRPKFRSALSKRIRFTGTGKLRLTQSNKAHGMIKHSSGQKRRQVGTVIACRAILKLFKRCCRLNPKSIKS
ncbi:MAG: 50S ribosomal protein L35 [Alphaproteobacteria bacterium]|nr:50S ribosomal protein L35 [Rickettsiales bacterium]